MAELPRAADELFLLPRGRVTRIRLLHRRELEQLGGERLPDRRRSTPLDPRAVSSGDQRRERGAVVMGGDRSQAPAADERDATSFGLDTARASRRRRLRRRGAPRRPSPGARARPGRPRAASPRVEAQTDLAAEPEPVEPARGQHDGVEATLAALAQPRVDVAAQRLDRERRLEREQLCAPPRGRRADRASRAGARPRRRARRADPLASCRRRRRGPSTSVDVMSLAEWTATSMRPLEQRFLELLHEHATSADLAERLRAGRGRRRS